MDVFEVEEVLGRLRPGALEYLEFLRVPATSIGLYRIPAGGTDPQHPHREDEIYLVTQGSATIRVEGETNPVGPGTIVYVPAHAEHRFEEVEEDLVAVVIFAPAETRS